jgi:hypothetical protein
VGEAHNGLVLDEMAFERVPRWASYVGTGCNTLLWGGVCLLCAEFLFKVVSLS